MELGLIAGTGWAAGLNVYAVALLLGLLGRLADAPVPELLQSTPALVVSGLLYLIEFIADKVPYLDSVWDVIHTPIRPLAAGFLGYLLAGELGMSEALGAGTAGVLALVGHATKMTTRAAVNVSPEPVSNIAVSVFEDGLVAGIVVLAVAYPLLALGVVLLFVVGGAALVAVLWRAVARMWRRLRSGEALSR
jgi:hypothetical protein